MPPSPLPLPTSRSKFTFRPALLTDTPSIISLFDASPLYLTSIGSSSQWGSIPFSSREGWVSETTSQIEDSERNRLSEGKNSDNERLRVFILEVETEQQTEAGGVVNGSHSSNQTAGVAFVRSEWIPSYISSQPHINITDAERLNSVYLEVMVSNHDYQTKMEKRPGVGKALIEGVCEFGRSLGKSLLFVDGWAGNEKKLIRYYEKQGFQWIADFSIPRKEKTDWVGMLMKMDI